MTETKRFILRSPQIVKNAVEAVINAPEGWTVTVSPPKRTTDQNSHFHALCYDIAKSGIKWDGKERDSDAWKIILVSAHSVATGGEAELVRGLEGELVNIRESTAKMGVARASSLIEYTIAWAVSNGVELTETKKRGFWDD